jgi:hypothetical protein
MQSEAWDAHLKPLEYMEFPVKPSSIEISVKSTAVLLLILIVVLVFSGADDDPPPQEVSKKRLVIEMQIKARCLLTGFMILNFYDHLN